MLITPTGCTAETLKPTHIVATGFDGASTGKLKPSSEWAMHAEIYARVPARTQSCMPTPTTARR
jgi:L-fuculose-phosphate aldolase